MPQSPTAVSLGLGLIGIGRPWGHIPAPVPSESETQALLEAAYDLGIRFYDTAPSYALSEERLGSFLRRLTAPERAQLTVATKFGDHWNAETRSAFVDHSFGALERSLERSLELLGSIDLLQLHKTTVAALQSADVEKAFDYARTLKIERCGASVSDIESGRLVCAGARYEAVQLPYNLANDSLGEVIDLAGARGITVLVNRPFNMGKLLYEADQRPAERDVHHAAFRFVLARVRRGVVLTGTTSVAHLAENWNAFHDVLQDAATG